VHAPAALFVEKRSYQRCLQPSEPFLIGYFLNDLLLKKRSFALVEDLIAALRDAHSESLKQDLSSCTKPLMPQVLHKQMEVDLPNKRASELGFCI